MHILAFYASYHLAFTPTAAITAAAAPTLYYARSSHLFRCCDDTNLDRCSAESTPHFYLFDVYRFSFVCLRINEFNDNEF